MIPDEFAALEANERDAKRYRWLKSRKSITLKSIFPSRWGRPDGTEFISKHYLAAEGTCFSPAETLDELIDNAMKE